MRVCLPLLSRGRPFALQRGRGRFRISNHPSPHRHRTTRSILCAIYRNKAVDGVGGSRNVMGMLEPRRRRESITPKVE